MMTEKIEVVLGTRNHGKIAEFRSLFKGMSIRILSFFDFPNVPEIKEDGKTFKENAEKKAKAIAKATNKIAIAEDSGLEVDYLEGEPGVRSARFTGENANDRDNTRRVLKLLVGVPWEKRTAKFVCIMCLAAPHGETLCAEGICKGRLSFEMRGTHGFGYDPIFIPDGQTLTMAEMDPRLKNKISHRADAMRRFRDLLKQMVEARKERV
jgi:XTP/dITP diphosphohydrolase